MEEIYKLFQDQYGYIANLDLVKEFLQKQNLNSEEITSIILKIYSNNLEVKKTLKKKNEIIKNMNLTTDYTSREKVKVKKETIKSEKTTNIPQINTLLYISGLSKDMDEETLEKLIPSTNENFNDIINMTLLDLIKMKVDLEKLQKEDKELSVLIDEELEQIESKINLLKDYRAFKTKVKVNTDNIRLIFTPSIIADFNSSSIPRELYKDFLSLILSFKKGLPKNYKIFKPGGCNYTVSEVRINGLRILYDKLNDTTYSLYYAFKKSERDTYYHDTLVSRANSYYENKYDILSEYYKSSTDYFKEHEESEKKLMKKLSGDEYGRTN